MFATIGCRYLKEAGKLNKQGSSSLFLGYGSTQTTIYSYGINAKKWCRSPCFRFDITCSSIPSHSLPLSYRNMLGKVKLEDATSLEIDTSSSSYDPNAGFTATLPLPSSKTPMHVSLRDDKSFNLPILTKLHARHPWRKHLPREYLSNVWLLATNDEEPIIASGSI